MSNQTNHSSQYPTGHIQYAFKMHAAHDRAISCKVAHSKARELIFEKVSPADKFDAKWLMTIHFGPVYSIEEVICNMGRSLLLHFQYPIIPLI